MKKRDQIKILILEFEEKQKCKIKIENTIENKNGVVKKTRSISQTSINTDNKIFETIIDNRKKIKTENNLNNSESINSASTLKKSEDIIKDINDL